MTLRFVVARILRELIELAECDDDVERIDAFARCARCGVAGGRAAVLKFDGVDDEKA